MIEIDGSQGEGGGQVLRTSLALAILTEQPVRIHHIRARRKKPGLQAQHLKAVDAAAAISQAAVDGAQLHSNQIEFHPKSLRSGRYRFEIGTAGSTSLVLQTILQPLAMAGSASSVIITGGTHVEWSPSFHYLDEIWRPTLETLGFQFSLSLEAAGFYPAGGGRISAAIRPAALPLQPLQCESPGKLQGIRGFSAVANLDLAIAERMKRHALRRLQTITTNLRIKSLELPSPSKGAAFFLAAEFESTKAGFSALGALGKPAERVADEAIDALIKFIESGAAVEEHLADQLLLPLSFAAGSSHFTTSRVTAHLLTNAVIVRAFLPVQIEISEAEGVPGVVTIAPHQVGETAQPMPRKILHLDLDAFFCSVEERLRPELRGKAFAVGGRPEERGVVASCSYPARLCGVRSAMPMARALRLCPDLIVIPSRHGVYSEISRAVMSHLYDLTPQVEKVSIDEAFLDASDLKTPPEEIARGLQAAIRHSQELPCSIGAATNKLVAKIANDVGKAGRRSGQPPNAITIVPPGEEAAFLAPLPVEALWGVGPKTAERLTDLGIRTIGDLARWPAADLQRRFGKNGEEMARHARGLDDRPVVTVHGTKSISQETTFIQDVRDPAFLKRTLRSLSDRVGQRLRQADLAGSTVRVKLRWADFTTLTRQVSLKEPTNQDDEIYAAALALFQAAWSSQTAVRLLGVGVSGLQQPARQLSLWDQTGEKGRRLQAAIDELRQRYGEHAIQHGSELDEEKG